LRTIVAFAASVIVGWALGLLVLERPDAWPAALALALAGLSLPFWSLAKPAEGADSENRLKVSRRPR
jgi:hypothetical protein